MGGKSPQDRGFSAERWAKIPGFDQYKVSDRGCVRSTSVSLKGERIRKQRKRKNGYAEVNLFNRTTRRYRFLLVHRLVLLAFVGEPPNAKMHACHIDGDRANNELANLRWGTAKENEADKERHGTHLIGESTNSARLTEDDVRLIRRLRMERPGRKWGAEELALKFSVHRSTIARVGKSLAPGVKHRKEADLGAQLLGVSRDGAQRLSGSPEQNVVDDLLVLQGNRGNGLRYGEDDMKIRTARWPSSQVRRLRCDARWSYRKASP